MQAPATGLREVSFDPRVILQQPAWLSDPAYVTSTEEKKEKMV